MRYFKFSFYNAELTHIEKFYKRFENQTFPLDENGFIIPTSFFGFSYKIPNLKIQGWDIYDPINEVKRMGINFNTPVFFIRMHYLEF